MQPRQYGAARALPAETAETARPATGPDGNTYAGMDAMVDRVATAGGVLLWLYRDIDYGGPRLAVYEGDARPGYSGDLIVELDGFWRTNLTAIGAGDLGWNLVELIPTEARLPKLRRTLPMPGLPNSHNDRIGTIRLLR